jgi:hypothetical protein
MAQAISDIIFGIKKGLNFEYHHQRKIQHFYLKVSKPPPDPQITPALSLSSFSKLKAASFIASSEPWHIERNGPFF